MSILNGRLIGLVSKIAPQAAEKMAIKKAFGAFLDSAYKAGSVTSRALRRWLPWRGAPNTDYDKGTQQTVVARSRDAHRNQPFARAVIERLKHNSVGTGIRPQSKIDYEYLGVMKEKATELERQIERDFYTWANSVECDLERDLNFWSIQALAYISWLITGDVLVNTPLLKRAGSKFQLKLQLIEGDRLENSNGQPDTKSLARGIQRDKYGAVEAYHVCKAHPNDTVNFTDRLAWDVLLAFGKETGRRRVLHLKEKDRPGQLRGVPFLAPVLELFKKLDRYSDAEIDAAITTSFITVFIKSMANNGYWGLPSSSTQTAEEEEKNQITLDNAAIVELGEGEDVTVNNPTRPNSQYDPFVNAVLTEAGATIGMPLEVLRLHFNASFSAARAALIQAWKLVMYHRRILVDYFCQPIWNLFIDEMVAIGRLKVSNYSDPDVRAAYCKARWVGIAKGAVKESEEVDASVKKIEAKLSTRQRESEELNGSDWLENIEQLGVEEEKIEEEGLNNGNGTGNTGNQDRDTAESDGVEGESPTDDDS